MAGKNAREFAVLFAGKIDPSLSRSASAAKRAVGESSAQAKAAAREIAAAEDRVKAARESQESAARKVAVAEARLDEVRKSGTAKTSQVLAAEDRLASARARHESATVKAKTAAAQLSKAQLDAADASKRLGDGLDQGAKSAGGWGDRMKKALGGGWHAAGRKAGDDYSDGVGQGVTLGTAKIRSAVGKTLGAISTGALKAIGGVALAGAGAASALGGVAAVKGFGRLKDIDNARASLDGLGHSAKTVETIMDNALKAVKGTAFGMGAAAKTAAVMVAAGVKPGRDLERTLRLVGDAATIGGTSLEEMGSIFGKVAANQRLSGEEMSQLLDRQIGLLPALADHYGVTAEAARKMVSDGKVSFEEFQIVMEKTVGGAAAKAGQKFEGSMENARAALSRLGAAVLGPVFDRLPSVLTGITERLDGLQPLAERVGEKLGVAFDRGVAAAQRLWAKFKEVRDQFRGVTDEGEDVKQPSWVKATIEGAERAQEALKRFGGWARGFWQGLSGDRPEGPLIPGSSIDLGVTFRTMFAELGEAAKGFGDVFEGMITDEKGEKTRDLAQDIKTLAEAVTALSRALQALNDPNSGWNQNWLLGGGSIYNRLFVKDTSTEDAKKHGEEVAKGFAEGVNTGYQDGKDYSLNPFKTFIVETKKIFGISSPSRIFHQIGVDTMAGYQGGLNAASPGAQANAAAVFGGIIDRIKRVLGISSPSTVAAAMATDFIAGWAGQTPGWLQAVGAWTDGLRTKLGEMLEASKRILGALGAEMRSLTAKPAKFVVDTVINKGLIGAYSGLRKVLPGLPVINPVPLGDLARYQDGGRVVPGAFTGRRDNVLGVTGAGVPIARVEPGEYVTDRKTTRRHAGLLEALPFIDRLPGFFMGGRLPTTPGRISRHSGYGWARWAGDMARPMGAPVYAWHDGIVAYVRKLATSYGWHIMVNHAAGLGQSLYAHLSRIGVAPGQAVSAGQRIGDVGSTGRSTGPHLHFEIRGGNSPIGAFFDGAAAFFDGVADFTSKITGPLNRLQEIEHSPFGKLAAGFPRLLAEAFKTRIKSESDKQLDSITSPGGLGGVEQWRGIVLRALSIMGQPASLADTTLRRMNQESSGNPRATNMWDINARRGTPSKGLMQVIDPTFRAYAHPSYNRDIYDPLSNVLASMRYAVARYGSLPAAYNRRGGYDSGGWLQPGLTLANNQTGKPEAVLTNSQWTRLFAALEALTAGQVMAEPSGDINLVLDGEVIARIARAEIRSDKKARLS